MIVGGLFVGGSGGGVGVDERKKVHNPLGKNWSENYIDGQQFPKPQTLRFFESKVSAQPLSSEFVYNFPTLRVPWSYDCEAFGPFSYNNLIPSRRLWCEATRRRLDAGLTTWTPTGPVIDEEFLEYVHLLQTVQWAKERGDGAPYVVVEVGARWGTWGFRALNAASVLHQPAFAWLIEPLPLHCESVAKVAALNQFKEGRDYNLTCGKADVESFRQFAARHPRIDLVDLDCQKCERHMVRDLAQIFSHQVYRLIIATHSFMIHKHLAALLRRIGFRIVSNALWHPMACSRRFQHEPVNKSSLLQCSSRTNNYGHLVNADGEIIAVNPNLKDFVETAEAGWN
eukprot:NODE_991_length_1183_cov_236.081129_g752_i0.p1 GENE.NODE_991_length_1183_cov_236.081129_g752_i0~~NODE_991_length_1183_cov_236.081129_g752_i0.p1  ORF type:complete len:374 (+),score=62.83 NODE_991_length_1183_cov_236.081129_g752_i0:101-1123(+)